MSLFCVQKHFSFYRLLAGKLKIGLASVRLTIGPGDLEGLFQPKWFYVYLKNRSSLFYPAGKQNAVMEECTALVLTNHSIPSVLPPANSVSVHSSYTLSFSLADVLLQGSMMSSLSSLLPWFWFLNIPECNNHSRFLSPLPSLDFLSSFPNMSGISHTLTYRLLRIFNF